MSDYKELLLGAGSRHEKNLYREGYKQWRNLTTLDYNRDHNPDVVWDLTDPEPLPFEPDTFDEIHAYEVLEHLGQQGDWRTFFRQFSDYWRILKPDGLFYATVPWFQSQWALGEPSHTRVITPGTLVFLDQQEYKDQVGETAMSDFRFVYKADFQVEWADRKPLYSRMPLGQDGSIIEVDQSNFRFVLRAVKPSRFDDWPMTQTTGEPGNPEMEDAA